MPKTKNRKLGGNVWRLPAGRLNSAISALDAKLATRALDTRNYFLGFKDCPGYAEDAAKSMGEHYHNHCVEACIAMGHNHVCSKAQAQMLWGQPGDDNIYTAITSRYDLDDLKEAAKENGSGQHDWRLVFYTGLNIGEQIAKYPRFFQTCNQDGCHPDADKILPDCKPPAGVYLVDFKPSASMSCGSRCTDLGMNHWLHNVCSFAQDNEVVPPPIFTQGLMSFMLLDYKPLPADQWYYTGMGLDSADPNKVLAIKFNNHENMVKLAAGVPIGKPWHMYLMKTPRKA